MALSPTTKLLSPALDALSPTTRFSLPFTILLVPAIKFASPVTMFDTPLSALSLLPVVNEFAKPLTELRVDPVKIFS